MAVIDYDSYEEFRDPVTYDLECDGFDADMPFIEGWARQLGSPMLDLACGTGRMAIHLAEQGYQVTGVDLILEMIAHARKKAAARTVSVDWAVADAREFRLGRQFPLIFMLMNAFQFLLTRADHEAMLARVREHLLPDGRFIFETRNPTPENLLVGREPDGAAYTAADGGKLLTSSQQYYDPLTQIQHYTSTKTHTHPDGTTDQRTVRVALRYVYPQEMEALLHYNGFRIEAVHGSWEHLEPLTAASPAMIYVCSLAR